MDERIHMELLAPAGGMEQLRAAVQFGADAVYLAADRFGMRARAANFRLDEIPAAVAFAHDHGVKVHVACNILMHPGDIDELPAFFRAMDAAGVDAFIIGDLGAFAVAGEVAPRVERHVSTQASVANATAARVWHSLGASRVVCAREMSLADIACLRQDAPPDLEIEAFAHGAMCMAVSGRCLISSYLTGRSGNKGHCTQPCRWSYQLGTAAFEEFAPPEAPTGFLLEEEKRPGEFFPIEEDDRGTFIMNAKDMNMLAHLRELARAGVDSIKIEGRNKKAFYVASVVGAYRRVLDGEPPAAVADELLAVSHRPYGTGFSRLRRLRTRDHARCRCRSVPGRFSLCAVPQPLCGRRRAGDPRAARTEPSAHRARPILAFHLRSRQSRRGRPRYCGGGPFSRYRRRLGSRRRGQPLLQPLPHSLGRSIRWGCIRHVRHVQRVRHARRVQRLRHVRHVRRFRWFRAMRPFSQRSRARRLLPSQAHLPPFRPPRLGRQQFLLRLGEKKASC